MIDSLWWLLEHLLVPLAQVFFLPLDLLFAWTFHLPPELAIAALGILTGLGVNLFMKWSSDQDLLGRAKADLARIRILRTAAACPPPIEKPGDTRLVSEKNRSCVPSFSGLSFSGDSDPHRLDRLANRVNRLYAWGSLKPSLWTILPICIIAMWMGSRLSYRPIRPGDVVELTARFEDGAGGFVHLLPNGSVAPEGDPIAAVAVPEIEGAPIAAGGVQARLKVRFLRDGPAQITLVHNGLHYQHEVLVRAAGGPPPEPFRIFPPGPPTMDRLTHLELGLADSVPPAWWNLFLKGIGIYLLVALSCGFGFRALLGIH